MRGGHEGAKRLKALALILALMLGLHAQDELELTDVSFDKAREWLEGDRYEDAGKAFGALLIEMDRSGASAREMAPIAFNKGLAEYLQAESMQAVSPRDALGSAIQSREAFLLAARSRPGYRRAGIRLDAVAGLVGELAQRVEEQERQEQEQDEKVEALLERIKKLRDDQIELKADVSDADIDRPGPNRRGNPAAPQEPLQPVDAELLAREFEGKQNELLEEGRSIQTAMAELDQEFSIATEASEALSLNAIESIMKRPLELMALAVDAQAGAAELLPQWNYWPSARARQTTAIDRLQEIIDLFGSNNEGEGEGEWEDEEWDEYSESEDGEGMSSSMPVQGEFRKDAIMQPLPLPNFSAEDILMEEMGSQQFRQQQRAKANAGKVGKDW